MLAADTSARSSGHGQEVIIHLPVGRQPPIRSRAAGWKLARRVRQIPLLPATIQARLRGMPAEFDIDSVGLLSMYAEMNRAFATRGAENEGDELFLGAVVTTTSATSARSYPST